MKLNDFVVRIDQLESYSPDAHAGTVNTRIIGSETVGARHVEVILGEIEPGGQAEPHFHSDIEQVLYLMEGRMEVSMFGEKDILEPGDTVFFPPGEKHQVDVIGDKPIKFLVIYGPPLQTKETPFER